MSASVPAAERLVATLRDAPPRNTAAVRTVDSKERRQIRVAEVQCPFIGEPTYSELVALVAARRRCVVAEAARGA